MKASAALYVAVVALAGFAALAAVPGAQAQTACTMQVNGQPAGEEAVVVDKDATMSYRLDAPRPIASWQIFLLIGPGRITAAEGDTGADNEASRVNGTVPLADYTQYGVGIYRARAEIVMEDRSTCTTDGLVRITGNPLTTVAGAAAAGAAAGGLAGVIAAVVAGLLDLHDVRDAIKQYRREHGTARAHAPGKGGQQPPPGR